MALLAGLVELLLADPADVGDVAGARGRRLAGGVVVALVQAEVLRALLGVWPLDDDGLDRRLKQLRVVDVCTLDLEPERAAVGLDD